MLPIQVATRHRISSKTSPYSFQTPVVSTADLDEAPEASKLMAYMITLPYPRQTHSSTGVQLVASTNFTTSEVLQKVLDCFRRPAPLNPASPEVVAIDVQRMGCWREWHQTDDDGEQHQHDHIPVLGLRSFRFVAVKRALLSRYGFASHWSKHCGYWSMVRYVAMPSPTKPLKSLDLYPALWDRDGTHPPLLDCCYAPVTATALNARRTSIVRKAAAARDKEPKVTDLDVWALVVRSGIRNTADNRKAHLQLVAYAKAHCGEAVVHYLWKRRQQLPGMIDDIWLWENIAEAAATAQRSRVEAAYFAAQAPCVCGGQWAALIRNSFWTNGIDARSLCHDIWVSLRDGRSEATPVVVLAGAQGGEGKSALLKPLLKIFQDGVFNVSKESGNFPLFELPLAKVAFLDEYRFDPAVVSFASLCLWFDGSELPIGRPQNIQGMSGNLTYKGSAPIFVTTKLQDLERLQAFASINPETGCPFDADASMLWRRLKVYRYTQKVPKPAHHCQFCARCFVDLLKAHADVQF